STTASGSLPSGGIFSSPACCTAATRRLLPASPTTAAGPRPPPLSSAARESRRRSPGLLAPPWHLKQCRTRTGRTLASKSVARSSGGAAVAAAVVRARPRRTAVCRIARRLGAGGAARAGKYEPTTGRGAVHAPKPTRRRACLYAPADLD